MAIGLVIYEALRTGLAGWQTVPAFSTVSVHSQLSWLLSDKEDEAARYLPIRSGCQEPQS